MADSTHVCELFKRFQHQQLQDTFKVLEVRADLDGITYSEADNHLTAAVSKMNEYQFPPKVVVIQASVFNSGGGVPRKGGRNSCISYNVQGEIHTGYYWS